MGFWIESVARSGIWGSRFVGFMRLSGDDSPETPTAGSEQPHGSRVAAEH